MLPISNIQSAAAQMTQQTNAQPHATAPHLGREFADLLARGIEKANGEQIKADNEVQKMVQTQGANMHETMIALTRADVTMRLTLKVGQKLVQAYQEVSRMHI